MRIWGITHRGVVRAENQDAYHFTLPTAGSALGVICDGMGGAKGGKTASRMAVRAFADWLRPKLQEELEEEQLKELLEQAAQAANKAVYERSREDPLLQGMGTTMVAVALLPGCAVVLNVGDSRAYHITGETLARITNDHSLVEDMVSHGKITREEAKHHPQKNLITRALGAEASVVCDLFSVPLASGDHLLLCSDGLTNLVSEEELLATVLQSGTPEVCCDQLLQKALSCGAPDNVTVVLFQI